MAERRRYEVDVEVIVRISRGDDETVGNITTTGITAVDAKGRELDKIVKGCIDDVARGAHESAIAMIRSSSRE